MTSVRANGIRTQAGFSLLEVLITLIVFAVGLLGLASLQAVSVQSNHSAYLRTQATNSAYEMLDAWRSDRGAILQSGELTDLDLWRDRIESTLPGGALDADVNANGQIDLTIGWLDSRRDNTEGLTEADLGSADEAITIFQLSTRI